MTETRPISPLRGWPSSPLWDHLTHYHFNYAQTQSGEGIHRNSSIGKKAKKSDRRRQVGPLKSCLIILGVFLSVEVTGEVEVEIPFSPSPNATSKYVIGIFKTQPEGFSDSRSPMGAGGTDGASSLRKKSEPRQHPPALQGVEMKSNKQTMMPISSLVDKIDSLEDGHLFQHLHTQRPRRRNQFNVVIPRGEIRMRRENNKSPMITGTKSTRSEAPNISSNSSFTIEVATPGAGGVNEHSKAIWKSKNFDYNRSSSFRTQIKRLKVKENNKNNVKKYKNNDMSEARSPMTSDEAVEADPPFLWRSSRHKHSLKSSHHYLSLNRSIQMSINSSLSRAVPSSRSTVNGFRYTRLNKSLSLKTYETHYHPIYSSLPMKNFPQAESRRIGGETLLHDKEKFHLIQPQDQKHLQVGHGKIRDEKYSSENLSNISKKGANTASVNNKQKLAYKEDLIALSTSSNRQKRKADMLEVSVMEGGLAELPCELHVINPNDSVQLILWIKEGIHTPLYSYDYRELQGGRPKEMKPDVNSTMAQRTSFRTDRSPPALLVEKVEADDAGIYRCRADFSLSPTINRRINLTVIVPPRRARVSWRLEGSGAKAVDDRVAGPFLENSQPTLMCSNDDGWPPASLSWYEDDIMIDDSDSFDNARGLVENELTLSTLTRGDMGRRFTCLASNSNSTQPATATVTIGMTLSILGVRVEEVGRVWAGERTEVECWVWGSRPPPTILWWLGSHMRTAAQNRMMDEGNLTISVLAFTPTPKEDGVMLICQATNDELPDQAVQDSRLLSVNYAPVVKIRLGPSLDPERIKEGDDVYFECSLKAKPAAFKVIWKQDGLELAGGEGVFVSNMSLVVQKVTRSQAGDYTCEATNIRDTTSSPPIHLDVKYTPLCMKQDKSQFAVGRKENTVVSCKVDANPSNVTFSWTFNNSAEAVHIPNDRFVVVGTESRVNYTPMDEMDYGTLQCWANNTIGVQSQPCLYKIIPAGKPDPPHNCRVSDVTISSLQVSCLPGDDGGLNQTFQIQVYQIGSTNSPVVEVKSPKPSFSVANLRPATPYKIIVTALNKMGLSRLIELKTYTARVPETQQETNAEPTRDRGRETGVPLVVLVGGGVVLVPLIVVIMILIRLKLCRNANSGLNNRRRPSRQSTDAPSTDIASEASGVDECDPDILSHTAVSEPSQWTEVGGDIATLPTSSLYSPPNGGGSVYPATIRSLQVSTPTGHPRGHPISHPQLHAIAVAAPQVPYFTDAHHSQHMGKVALLSAASFTQDGQNPGNTIDIQGYPPPFDFNGKQQQQQQQQQQQPYAPFSHICHSVSCSCITLPQSGPQYSIPQFQESLQSQVPLEGGCPHGLQGIVTRGRSSKRGVDNQRHYSVSLSPSKECVSLAKNELLQPQISFKSGKESGTLKRSKGSDVERSEESDKRTVSDAAQPKVESSV